MTTEIQDETQAQTASETPAPLKNRRPAAQKPHVAKTAGKTTRKASGQFTKTAAVRAGSKTAKVIALLEKSKRTTFGGVDEGDWLAGALGTRVPLRNAHQENGVEDRIEKAGGWSALVLNPLESAAMQSHATCGANTVSSGGFCGKYK